MKSCAKVLKQRSPSIRIKAGKERRILVVLFPEDRCERCFLAISLAKEQEYEYIVGEPFFVGERTILCKSCGGLVCEDKHLTEDGVRTMKSPRLRKIVFLDWDHGNQKAVELERVVFFRFTDVFVSPGDFVLESMEKTATKQGVFSALFAQFLTQVSFSSVLPDLNLWASAALITALNKIGGPKFVTDIFEGIVEFVLSRGNPPISASAGRQEIISRRFDLSGMFRNVEISGELEFEGNSTLRLYGDCSSMFRGAKISSQSWKNLGQKLKFHAVFNTKEMFAESNIPSNVLRNVNLSRCSLSKAMFFRAKSFDANFANWTFSTDEIIVPKETNKCGWIVYGAEEFTGEGLEQSDIFSESAPQHAFVNGMSLAAFSHVPMIYLVGKFKSKRWEILDQIFFSSEKTPQKLDEVRKTFLDMQVVTTITESLGSDFAREQTPFDSSVVTTSAMWEILKKTREVSENSAREKHFGRDLTSQNDIILDGAMRLFFRLPNSKFETIKFQSQTFDVLKQNLSNMNDEHLFVCFVESKTKSPGFFPNLFGTRQPSVNLLETARIVVRIQIEEGAFVHVCAQSFVEAMLISEAPAKTFSVGRVQEFEMVASSQDYSFCAISRSNDFNNADSCSNVLQNNESIKVYSLLPIFVSSSLWDNETTSEKKTVELEKWATPVESAAVGGGENAKVGIHKEIFDALENAEGAAACSSFKNADFVGTGQQLGGGVGIPSRDVKTRMCYISLERPSRNFQGNGRQVGEIGIRAAAEQRNAPINVDVARFFLKKEESDQDEEFDEPAPPMSVDVCPANDLGPADEEPEEEEENVASNVAPNVAVIPEKKTLKYYENHSQILFGDLVSQMVELLGDRDGDVIFPKPLPQKVKQPRFRSKKIVMKELERISETVGNVITYLSRTERFGSDVSRREQAGSGQERITVFALLALNRDILDLLRAAAAHFAIRFGLDLREKVFEVSARFVEEQKTNFRTRLEAEESAIRNRGKMVARSIRERRMRKDVESDEISRRRAKFESAKRFYLGRSFAKMFTFFSDFLGFLDENSVTVVENTMDTALVLIRRSSAEQDPNPHYALLEDISRFVEERKMREGTETLSLFAQPNYEVPTVPSDRVVVGVNENFKNLSEEKRTKISHGITLLNDLLALDNPLQ